jgi:hypothetical protein
VARGVSLASARAKLHHARSHIGALETFVGEFIGRPESWPLLQAQLDWGSGYHVFQVSARLRVPDPWRQSQGRRSGWLQGARSMRIGP